MYFFTHQQIVVYSNVSMSSTTSAVSTVNKMENSKVFQMSQEVMALFRKLQKKDAITKVKALNGLQAYVKTLADEEVLMNEYAEDGKHFIYKLCFINNIVYRERAITAIDILFIPL